LIIRGGLRVRTSREESSLPVAFGSSLELKRSTTRSAISSQRHSKSHDVVHHFNLKRRPTLSPFVSFVQSRLFFFAMHLNLDVPWPSCHLNQQLILSCSNLSAPFFNTSPFPSHLSRLHRDRQISTMCSLFRHCELVIFLFFYTAALFIANERTKRDGKLSNLRDYHWYSCLFNRA